MNFKIVVAALTSLVVALSVPSLQASDNSNDKSTGHDDTAKAGHSGTHWSYEGPRGPEHWGSLSDDYSACEIGLSQSPIDVGASGENGLITVEFEYYQTPLNIVNNGHTVQVNYEPGSGITVDGDRYELLQFHFHTPSEHARNGKRTAMEVHFVHKSASGTLAVVGAFIESGEHSRPLNAIWDHMPDQAGPAATVENVLISARDLLPKQAGFYHYKGSLTTPPCSEGVNWYVLDKPITADSSQVDRFNGVVGENARPIQQLNGRNILALTPRK